MPSFNVQEALRDGVSQEKINQYLSSHPNVKAIDANSFEPANKVASFVNKIVPESAENPYNLTSYVKNTVKNAQRFGQGAGSLANLAARASSVNPVEAFGAYKQVGGMSADALRSALEFLAKPVGPVSGPESRQASIEGVNRLARGAYNNPLDATAMIQPFISKLFGAGAGADAVAEEAVPAVSRAERTGIVGEELAVPGAKRAVTGATVPLMEEVTSRIPTGWKRWMAKNAIVPDPIAESIGAITKEENIGKDIIDTTKGISRYSVAKEIEPLYKEVNTALDKIIESKSTQLGPIPVFTTKSGPGMLDEISASLQGNKVMETFPAAETKARNYVGKLLKSKAAHDPNLTGEFTTVKDINEARKNINSSFPKGPPDVPGSDSEAFEYFLYQYEIGLASHIAEISPEARQLVTWQHELNTAYRQLHGNLGQPKVPGSVWQVPGRIANTLLSPLEIILSREPNSQAAQTLKRLLETSGGTGVQP